jgi:hypothetical protein
MAAIGPSLGILPSSLSINNLIIYITPLKKKIIALKALFNLL